MYKIYVVVSKAKQNKAKMKSGDFVKAYSSERNICTFDCVMVGSLMSMFMWAKERHRQIMKCVGNTVIHK